MSAGNPFILGSKGQVYEAQKTVPVCILHSCECWLLLVKGIITDTHRGRHAKMFDERLNTSYGIITNVKLDNE